MKPSVHLKLTVAYDGARFAGWQRQKSGRTVQEALEQALRKITGHPAPVTGAGRTDSGVHAQGQVAHATIRSGIRLPDLHRALNALLPEDVVIRSLRLERPDFHARYDAEAKRYLYTIWNHPIRPLFERDRVWHVARPLEVGRMRQAARRMRGRHDFRAFHSSGRPVRSTVRNLRSLSVRKNGARILIEAEADGFLYHMARRIVGLLVEIGAGRWAVSAVPQLLSGEERRPAPTAPGRGLCLLKVSYRRRQKLA